MHIGVRQLPALFIFTKFATTKKTTSTATKNQNKKTKEEINLTGGGWVLIMLTLDCFQMKVFFLQVQDRYLTFFLGKVSLFFHWLLFYLFWTFNLKD